MLPYFKKGLTFTPPDYAKRGGGGLVDYDASAFGPDRGPLHVLYANYWSVALPSQLAPHRPEQSLIPVSRFPISTYFQQGFSKLGIVNIPGLNSGELTGYSEATQTVDPRSGTRSSSETAYLRQAIEENNSLLQLYQQSLAKKIVFNGTVATGLQVTTSGVPYTLSAAKEVIVAAGVVSLKVFRIGISVMKHDPQHTPHSTSQRTSPDL